MRGLFGSHRRLSSLSSSLLPDEHALRELLRKSAQPVTVLTSHYPSSPNSKSTPAFHGATLSSFTSISLNPLPLVAFSIRMPSRTAESIRPPSNKPIRTPHLVINVLAASQSVAAVRFSRADLYPEPFFDIPYHLTQEGIPVLSGCVGAISCSLLSSIPLHADALRGYGVDTVDIEGAMEERGTEPEAAVSELFIARVLRVEDAQGSNAGLQNPEATPLPLIYHERKYGTVQAFRLAGTKNGT